MNKNYFFIGILLFLTLFLGACKQNVNEEILEKENTLSITFQNGVHGIVPEKIEGLKEGDILVAEQLAISSQNSGFEFVKWTDTDGKEVKAGDTITGNLVLTANWKDIAPGKVTDVEAFPENTQVKLTWKNPEDDDLEKVIISGEGISQIEITNKSTESIITGLESGKEYTVTLIAEDKGSNKSEAVTITFYTVSKESFTPFVPTETPKFVKEVEINGKKFHIVKFGDWPQTKYDGQTDVLKPCANVNAWDNCFTDGNGAYYVKVNATPKYKEGLDNDPNKKETIYKFDDETPIEKNAEYYFKIEPIEWKILTDNYNNSNNKLLLAEKALDSCAFFSCKVENDDKGNSIPKNGIREISGKKIENNNYEYSEVRAFLLGIDFIGPDSKCNSKYKGKGFLQKAFTQNAINKIAVTSVDNSIGSTLETENNSQENIGSSPDNNGYYSENTNDKVFLLSSKEVTTKDYGFNPSNEPCDLRKKIAPDYARATGILYNENINNELVGFWWLRSPQNHNEEDNTCGYSAKSAEFNGYGKHIDYVSDSFLGIVPALAISF